ncbi:MAG: hypothetical protein WB555_23325, partial [Candidatus Korobacteraceae bacterium]
MIALAIILGVWYVFLKFVEGGPKFEAEPVLIMIWLSALLLILALQPELLSGIKGFKIGELLEIELRDSLQQSTQEDYTSLLDLGLDEDQGILA